MGDEIVKPIPSTTEEEAPRTRTPRVELITGLVSGPCPGCGAPLSDYEVFASRIRGLKIPVCYGCLAKALVHLGDNVLPMLDGALASLEELADKIPQIPPRTKGGPSYMHYHTTAPNKSGIVVRLGPRNVDLVDMKDEEQLAWILQLDTAEKVRLIMRILSRYRG